MLWNHGRLSEFSAETQFLAKLDTDQMQLLNYAIRHHVGGAVSDDPTIGACWDADRLDLRRAGIITEARYMSTARGKALVNGRNC